MAGIDDLPVAVIGGGPVGLAAAAELVRRGVRVKLYEAGAPAANVRDWGHVRLFSPWRYCISPAARDLLAGTGWVAPPEDELPTGGELVSAYLAPLAERLGGVIETGARVLSVGREGLDKTVSAGRQQRPFVLAVATSGGRRRDRARAVIDASGTWGQPNPLGADGLPADGEAAAAGRIAYGIPDVLGRDRAAYAGKSVLVVGSGHSAANVLLDLARLAEAEPGTAILWAIRGSRPAFGGGTADALPARGALGSGLRRLVESGRIGVATGFRAGGILEEGGRLVLEAAAGGPALRLGPVDRIVVATGQRPDLGMTRELRLDLDAALESARALGPLIDPNVHSCGSVPPHGHRELAHPAEPDFYTAGIKSYGRAPTFLMLTGYEQVRSIAAALAGDLAAADDVRLVLPETGVCSTDGAADAASAGCCGGPAASPDACCRADAEAKAAGEAGCGCGSAAADTATAGVAAVNRRTGGGLLRHNGPPGRLMDGAPRLSPAHLVAILGATQIVGYGTLYYGFAILAADMAAELGWQVASVFGVFSAALLLGGLAAPAVGRAIDRHGAGTVMAVGSPLAAAALALTALAPGAVPFMLGVATMQVASALVLYDAAFAALVQAGGRHARRHITHLTLIAGFASTVFWPITTWLDGILEWRMVLLAYAGLNLLVCLPLHLLIARRASLAREEPAEDLPAAVAEAPLPVPLRRRAFLLAAAGFALSGFLLSAVLAQMVPMLASLGLAGSALAVSALFGPAQVLVRLANMLFGKRQHPLAATLVAGAMLPAAVTVLALTAPVPAGAVVFAVMLGLGSGLKSIVQGSLPLALFGHAAYGSRLGRMALVRQVLAATAPFCLAGLAAALGPTAALAVLVAIGLLGLACFVELARLRRLAQRQPAAVPLAGAALGTAPE